MKFIIHKVIGVVLVLAILKVGIDSGLWLMNYPTDMTFFLGLCLIIIVAYWSIRSLIKASMPEYTNIKQLFTFKD